jgi:hypothetical protein
MLTWDSWGLHFPVGAAAGRAPCQTTHNIVSLEPPFIAFDDTVCYPNVYCLTVSFRSILNAQVSGMVFVRPSSWC